MIFFVVFSTAPVLLLLAVRLRGHWGVRLRPRRVGIRLRHQRLDHGSSPTSGVGVAASVDFALGARGAVPSLPDMERAVWTACALALGAPERGNHLFVALLVEPFVD